MVFPGSEAASPSESDKTFESMNMDEFLNSIWTAEENQAHAQAQAQAHAQVQAQAQAQAHAQAQAQVQPHPPARPQHYAAAMYPNSNTPPAMAPTYVGRPVMGLGCGTVPAYQALPQGGYAQPSPSVYGGRMGNGIAVGYPVNPVSSGGLCVNPGGDNGGNPYGLETGIRGGRKRIVDGPEEKVVESRKRRMIKNRESALRSRAKQEAYTLEIEAEINQLKEENASLKQALEQAEMDKKRKQQAFEEGKPTTPTKAQKANEELRLLRRSLSCPP